MPAANKIISLVLVLTVLVYGCGNKNTPAGQLHFTLLQPGETAIHFNNRITESDSVNVFTNEYMYNGSGVGVGDFNNDGLTDVFFCGSMVSSKFYLNKGNFKFEDITEKAGLVTGQWCTGVSVVDINSDGLLDLYISVSHSHDATKRKNLLFVNKGNLQFTEQAAAYNVADTGCATQAAFFDYDKDGDLDMYLLNHRLYSYTANNLQPKDTSGLSPAQDKLYRNEGRKEGQAHPVFTDVTAAAGITEDGYGLGLSITDFNNDGWPDVYVANDYIANDLLWLNNRNGTFTNTIAASLKHESYNSMGADAADINNDGMIDLAVMDMLPETNERKKMMFSATSQEKYDMQQRFGYQPSFVRNMLQLNNGNRYTNAVPQPYFSEIGQLAGIFETDWSWSVLMADFDNDGWKDIHITNGLEKDVTNNDYASFRNGEAQGNYMFGSANTAENTTQKKSTAELRKAMDEFGSVKMENYFFHNNGNLVFSNTTTQTGLSLPSVSNGAAYADLDNDGDLDLLVNNINDAAFVWRNDMRTSEKDTLQNFITVQLQGDSNNLFGYGAAVTLFSDNAQQLAEQFPVRGFSSSVDTRLHFGMGNRQMIDSLKVVWPDGKTQVIKNVNANQLLLCKQQAAVQPGTAAVMPVKTLFTEISSNIAGTYKHAETPNFDFGYHQPLLQKYSQMGPCIATGDVNGDGMEDFFVGGAANQPGKIVIQNDDGSFTGSSITTGLKPGEDLGAVFFDADGDKDADLLVTGGSFEFTVAKYNQPVLYKNDGKGRFTADETALPLITDITDALAVADYDNDGDMDIFIGGRLAPQKYPQSPRSYLLQNNDGRFTDVTKAVCTTLETAGMVTAALFTDFNNDGKKDLVVCGEWMALRFFKNENNRFTEITAAAGLQNTHGFWRSLQQADLDNDGDMDYIAGNMGMNNRFHITAAKPMYLFAKDIDKNNFTEIIPAYYSRSASGEVNLYPAPDRNQLADQLPAVKKKYLFHADYAKVTMPQFRNDWGADGWEEWICETAASVWIENAGNGKFNIHALPLAAQFAPVNCILAADMDADGAVDLVIAGNEYQAPVTTGRYDASFGLFLKGNGKGAFTPVNFSQSGLLIEGDVKDMKMLRTKNKDSLLLAAPNDELLKMYMLHP